MTQPEKKKKKKGSLKTNGQHTSRGLHENEELTAPGAMRGESPPRPILWGL